MAAKPIRSSCEEEEQQHHSSFKNTLNRQNLPAK